jgi:hypothetical protein
MKPTLFLTIGNLQIAYPFPDDRYTISKDNGYELFEKSQIVFEKGGPF